MLVDVEPLVQSPAIKEATTFKRKVAATRGGPEHVAIGMMPERIHLEFVQTTWAITRVHARLSALCDCLEGLPNLPSRDLECLAFLLAECGKPRLLAGLGRRHFGVEQAAGAAQVPGLTSPEQSLAVTMQGNVLGHETWAGQSVTVEEHKNFAASRTGTGIRRCRASD